MVAPISMKKLPYKRKTPFVLVSHKNAGDYGTLVMSDLGKVVREPDPNDPPNPKINKPTGYITHPEPGREATYSELRAFKETLRDRKRQFKSNDVFITIG